MKWGLSQGILGRTRDSMAPSFTAVGPNTYLTQADFLKMVGLAVVAHVVVFTIAALMPREEVTNIPVQALSFKLGDGERIAAYSAPAPVAAPVMEATNDEIWEASDMPPPVVPAPLKPLPREAKPLKKKPQPEPAVEPQPAPAAIPAMAASPQQYVREVGAAPVNPVQAAIPSATAGTAAHEGTITPEMRAIRDRYEQQISGWIQQHKYYPAAAGGREGRAIIRMRIDRSGYVRYYAVEQSAGTPALDTAAIDMIRRANPVPAVPADYPAGNLVEFLIPITFKAP